jgi:hypothetical protein
MQERQYRFINVASESEIVAFFGVPSGVTSTFKPVISIHP